MGGRQAQVVTAAWASVPLAAALGAAERSDGGGGRGGGGRPTTEQPRLQGGTIFRPRPLELPTGGGRGAHRASSGGPTLTLSLSRSHSHSL